jgi:hypothetical protein
MPGNLVHVSTQDYADNHVVAVPAGGQTHYQKNLVATSLDGAEGPLEDGRPAAAQSRLTTQYAFDSVYYAQDYGSTQYKGQTLYFYQVSMENPTKVPMAMVEAIRIAAGTEGVTKALLNALVEEYWNPTQKWNVYEYLAGSMKILKKLPYPNMGSMEGLGAPNAYMDDVELATKLRKLVLAGKPIPPVPAAGDGD